MIRRPPRSTHCISSAASDVYKRQHQTCHKNVCLNIQTPEALLKQEMDIENILFLQDHLEVKLSYNEYLYQRKQQKYRQIEIIIKINKIYTLSLIHISEPTRLGMISYAVFCLKKKKQNKKK
eukprot:TRINITY_DN18788_c0_g1_i1.p3 TRINITY_DN18788_c0_g1~~TRINITY_DN18788_c0_g1_i1.p3  ORF type:complete len:122 (-),score=28.11 TRINITY_DN18788_c0_g1_i1:54-419(-)